ncbi:MAG TPA: beta-propeller fold lactonase family protein [Syntrophomonadaceae bacterium]|nr:beta-propeller fold lactonase family protein [Syntrophomonadaceae bacterium]
MTVMNEKRPMGNVYAMTNEAPNNEVVAFRRGIHGKLTRMKSFETGGSGTGEAKVDPLSSQGSLILTRNGQFLFVVNAGSDSISSFRVDDCGALILEDVEPSGGVRPNSLAVHGNLLYVTNVGNPANKIASNVTGFHVDKEGRLTRIIGSTHSLSTPNAQPACVVFSPDGRQIVVSELNNNILSVFRVNRDGTLIRPTVNNSSGAGPFGSDFLSSGLLLVSESGANALSSYSVDADGDLRVISGSVRNGQLATCWVTTSRCEEFAYTSNAGSGTITTYRIRDNGTLGLLRVGYSTVRTLAAPIDIGVSKDGCNFYVLNGNQGSITVFSIRQKGLILRIQVLQDTGLPTLGAQGLAVL